MNKIDEIKNDIIRLQIKLEQIQNECSHPKSALEKEGSARTGNYYPYEETYWINFHCPLCDKRWAAE